jgi:Phage integrase, N-terminal SAM-like domain
VQDVIRLKHYSYQIEKTYIYWIRRYILFHNKRHPKDMGSKEIEEFLTHLAVNENVAASKHTALPAAMIGERQGEKLDCIIAGSAVTKDFMLFFFGVFSQHSDKNVKFIKIKRVRKSRPSWGISHKER